MTSVVSFKSTQIAVLRPDNSQISIQVERTGTLTQDASVAVMLNGSPVFESSADQYNGIQQNLTWTAGEGGTKTAVFNVLPSQEGIEFIEATLVNPIRTNLGVSSATVAIHNATNLPSWLQPGVNYMKVVTQSANGGLRTVLVPISQSQQGSQGGIGSLNGVTPNTQGGNIVLEGRYGISITPVDTEDKVQIGLPVATGTILPGQLFTLIWNSSQGIYEARAIPAFQGSTNTTAGQPGLVPAPTAGPSNRYLSPDGNWYFEGEVPGQVGGTNGRVVRLSGANTWVDASNTDQPVQLYRAALLYKQNNRYFKPGTLITGLVGLIPGTMYYLGVGGVLTATYVEPTQTVRSVPIGIAYSATTLMFEPGIVITGN